MVLECISKLKSPLVNVTFEVITAGSDKENKADEGDKPKMKKKFTQHNPVTLPSNVNKMMNIRLLQEWWKCAQKMLTCMGIHCFVDGQGVHLPLSHERTEYWAFVMVSSVPLLHSLLLIIL